jgi:hypothetical protein
MIKLKVMISVASPHWKRCPPLILSAFGIRRDIFLLLGWKPIVKFYAHWFSWEIFVEMVMPIA